MKKVYGLKSDERPMCWAFPEGCETCYNKCSKLKQARKMK